MAELDWLNLQGAGAMVGAIGAFAGAQAQRSNFKLQADLAEINAQMAERSAQAALLAGQHEEQRAGLATAQLKGTQRAGMAGRGIDLGSGSAARVLTTTDVMGQADRNTIAANAVRAAWGYRTQGTNYQNEALTRRAAASATSPALAAGTSLLNSAGSVASNWYAMKRSRGG